MRKTKAAREAEEIARANFEKTGREVNEAEVSVGHAAEACRKAQQAAEAAERQLGAVQSAAIAARDRFHGAAGELRRIR
jgi:hypothetical protein